MPVSNDTLLRVVRFAFRRGQRYGTIVCDLEWRRPVTLLPNQEQDTSRAWLAGHPSISIVARDRGGGYGEAIAKALPHADQVANPLSELAKRLHKRSKRCGRKTVRVVFKGAGQLTDMQGALHNDDAKLSQMTAQRIDRLGVQPINAFACLLFLTTGIPAKNGSFRSTAKICSEPK